MATSNANGYWKTGGAFTTAPTSSQPAVIATRVVLPAFSSAAVCSSISFSSANGLLGELIAAGPKAFVTVGGVKWHLGTATAIEQTDTAGQAVPRGTVG